MFGFLETIAERSPVATFYAVACGFSWSIQAVLASSLFGGVWAVVLLLTSVFGPAVGAATVVRARGGSVRRWLGDVVHLEVPWWVFAVAIAVPLVFVAVHLLALLAVGATVTLAVGPTALVTFLSEVLLVAAVGGGQEEFGWRGFALPHLQESYSPLTASGLIAVLWAVWHFPTFYLFPTPLASGSPPSPLLYTLLTVGLSYALTVVFNAAAGSVVPAIVLHGINNANGALYDVANAPSLLGFGGAELLETIGYLFLAGVLCLVVKYGPGSVDPVRRRAGLTDRSAVD